MQNPNKIKNRVPTSRELTSLRAIASRKEELSNSMNKQISEAQATYDEIIARHENQMAILESIQSEMHAAKQYVNLLQAQKAIFDNEMNELCGVLHPIRRMPVETLRHIFEETLEASSMQDWTKWWQAIQLSHVCQHWRTVALNAPTLWSVIIVDFWKPLNVIAEYWNWVIQRVKMVPVDVSFNHFGGRLKTNADMWTHNEKQQEKVTTCNLLQIPVIRSLKIEADVTYSILDALSMITKFPAGELEFLWLGGRPGSKQLDKTTSWDWSGFFHRFPPFKSLELQYLDMLSFSRSQPFYVLKNLHIGSRTRFNTLELLCLCPNLERLTIEAGRASYPGHQNHIPVTIPTLTFLEVTEESTFPWDAPFHFPSLSTLLVATTSASSADDFYHFLTNHSSISDLKISAIYLDLTRLATAAPQLTKLTISFDEGSLDPFLDWTSTSLQGPAFPQLEILDLDNTVLDLGEFDHFVQARCTTIIPSYNQYHDFIAILRLPKRPPPSYPASRAPLSKSHQT
ncbi:hypothetical protein M408DRAFT_31165 [Serendipita vermifera MAFF 305830]|uniref:Uncharacterized protein n=1 Tax=Serendipita vermifera MAFF 305830 TaxID=933852 RepID=A0A0C3A4A2_SERVB|nr:hypothetical protein M408DRAFT_31165 [Serendipita vermifera MAFF 305830]